MNKYAKRVVLSGMAVIMMVSCGTAKKGGQSDTGVASKGDMEAIDNDYLILSDAQRDLLAKNNTFAINLFNKTNGMDSRVISPLSVTGLMTILANGADGDTRQEILNTLGWTGASMEEINEIYGLLVKQAGVIDPSVTVNVADYVAVNKDNRINNEFGKTVGDLFGTEVRNLDFTSPKTVNTINGWCSKHTGGMIPRIIDNVDPGAVAYLMNAIYFNGPWAERFQTKDTKVEAFRGYTRDIKKVMMMHRNDEYSYTANGTYSAVRLPYGNGSFAMTVLLPNEGKSIDDMMRVVNAKEIANLGRKMENCKVDLKLPKFTTEVEQPLNEVIAGLGAPTMFKPGADFSRLADGNMFVSKMFQKAKIEVSEEGTKAAAATAAIMTMSAYEPEPRQVEFHADRPFVYLISESDSGAIYFIGQFTGSEI